MKITKVKILKKPLTAKDKKGQSTLYLDFYPPLINPQTGKSTRREFLNLWIYDNPKSKDEKEHNKNYLNLCDKIKAKRELDIHAQRFDFLIKEKIDKDFLKCFRDMIDDTKSESNKKSHMSSYSKLKEFCNDNLYCSQINNNWISKFSEYLIDTLKRNTARVYLASVKSLIRKLSKTNDIKISDVSDMISIGKDDVIIQYLTLEELKRLIDTDCKKPELKRAAIFSALTGLRFSDVQKLTWGEIQKTDTGHEIVFRQKKTRHIENLPINENVFSLLGARKQSEDNVFDKIAISAYDNLIIKLWVQSANIDKHITFHCFRHTYATLLLNNGVDIYTVSKMLGHRDIKTTQIYAKISDSKKRNAANAIKIDLDNINKKF